METIEKIELLLKKADVSSWKGSMATAGDIAHQIFERWGEQAMKQYDPRENCFTFRGWQERGYKIKKGEKSLRTFTFMPCAEEKKLADGTVKKEYHSFPKTVCLFYINQVEKR